MLNNNSDFTQHIEASNNDEISDKDFYKLDIQDFANQLQLDEKMFVDSKKPQQKNSLKNKLLININNLSIKVKSFIKLIFLLKKEFNKFETIFKLNYYNLFEEDDKSILEIQKYLDKRKKEKKYY